MCQNDVVISGKIHHIEKEWYKHLGVRYYKFIVETKRLSDTSDFLPIAVAEKDFFNLRPAIGDFVKIVGQIHSRNKKYVGEERTKLILSVVPDDITVSNQLETRKNTVKLSGFICRKPVYRKTPLGRQISDLLIAVNGKCNRSYYIPLIVWGSDARICSTLEVGTKIAITGRFQSRKYIKLTNTDEAIEKIAYEVSVSRLELWTDT